MNFIVLFFLLSYGGIHCYVLCKLKGAFNPPFWFLALTFVIFLFMALAPLMVHAVGRHDGYLIVRIFYFITFGWMGLIFFFFCFSLLLDIYGFILYASGRFWKGDLHTFLPSLRLSFIIPLFLSFGIFGYGLFEASAWKVEHFALESKKVPEAEGRIRIVQITDLHIGMVMRGERLNRLIRLIKESEPDMLVSTGDLLDARGDGLAEACSLFKSITPRFGKFAVTGNHEYYAGLEHSLDFTRRAGFYVLRGKGLSPSGLINIAGIDDEAVRRGETLPDLPLRKIFASLPKDKFTLFLRHRPEVEKDVLGMFDLQLSGHTHKGQIFPFNLLTRLFFPMQAGFFTLRNGSILYVNRGAGTWGPPIRFLSPPEITIIDLLPGTGKI